MIIPLVFGAVLSDGWRGLVVTASGWPGEHEQEGQPEDAHLGPQRVLDRGGGVGTHRITSMANDT
jgi:hypothetical protein